MAKNRSDLDRDRPNPYREAGAAAAATLEPIKQRMMACSLLLIAAIDDVAAKSERAATASDRYAEFAPAWAPAAEWPQLRERYQASAVELKDSSKLRRAMDEMKIVRANLDQIVRELERLVA